MTVCGLNGLAAPGMWVDFGLSAVTVGLCIPEPVCSGETEAGAAELELVPFAYGGCACIGQGVLYHAHCRPAHRRAVQPAV